MALLTIVAADVHSVRIDGPNAYITAPAGEAIAAGNYVRLNTTTGHLELGNGTTAGEARDGGIALTSAAVGVTCTAQRTGIIDIGDAMTALAYDADVFLADTDGRLGDVAGTVSKVVGTVVPAFGTATPDKLLQLKDL